MGFLKIPALTVRYRFYRPRASRVRPRHTAPALTVPHSRLSPTRIKVTGWTTPMRNQDRTCRHNSRPQPPARLAVRVIHRRWEGNHSPNIVAPVKRNIKGTKVPQIAIQYSRDQLSHASNNWLITIGVSKYYLLDYFPTIHPGVKLIGDSGRVGWINSSVNYGNYAGNMSLTIPFHGSGFRRGF